MASRASASRRSRQTDGPAGVRLSHQETGLPAPVGLTATFDRDAANAYGVVIGREGRATNQDVLYAPMINQVAFQTAGRNFETLGEDPFLAGELVADETLGVQSEGLIVTLKHMAMNDFENSRTNTAVKLDERMLHELELQAFEKGIEEGHAGLDHVRLQPHQPVGHRLRHLLVRQQPAAERRSRATRSASRAGC